MASSQRSLCLDKGSAFLSACGAAVGGAATGRERRLYFLRGKDRWPRVAQSRGLGFRFFGIGDAAFNSPRALVQMPAQSSNSKRKS